MRRGARYGSGPACAENRRRVRGESVRIGAMRIHIDTDLASPSTTRAAILISEAAHRGELCVGHCDVRHGARWQA